MLGEDRIGIEQARTVKRAFGDDALPFAKQIGQHALIRDGDIAAAIGHVEVDFQIVAAHQTSWLHQSAKPDAGARRDMLLGHIGR